MYILGISCFYHESAACLIRDGVVVAASSEERFTRIKHDSAFPRESIQHCLHKADVTSGELSYVVFYEKPFVKFQRILKSVLASYPNSARLFAASMSNWLTQKLWVKSILSEELGVSTDKILFIPHHLSHAAASYYPSGFGESAILTVDGVGEWTTNAFGVGHGTDIIMKKEIRFPHSLGLLYSVFTAFLGFEVNDGEYKVMGMAPYGNPKYINKVKKLMKIYSDGSYSLNMEYFAFHTSVDLGYSNRFIREFGTPRPKNLHFFTKTSGYPSYFGTKQKNFDSLCQQNQYYADIASSIQSVTEEILLRQVQALHKETGMSSLCIGGGVALNSVANGVLLTKGPFKRIFVQPAAGDDGGALGCALYVYHALLKNKLSARQRTSYFGESFTAEEIESMLRSKGIPYKKILSESVLVKTIVDYLVAGKVIGFFHGRAEWGPRALGSRSILANPMRAETKDTVNVKIKFREPYRPFAPVVLEEKASEYFDLPKRDWTYLTDFMLAVFPVKRAKRKTIPAVTHIDGSARPQTITRQQNKRYYEIIRKFGRKTGVPVLLNTSFNLKGEPIVNSPQDALKTFQTSGLDLLVLENCIIEKDYKINIV